MSLSDLALFIRKSRRYLRWTSRERMEVALTCSDEFVPADVVKRDFQSLLHHNISGLFSWELASIAYKARYGEPDPERALINIKEVLTMTPTAYSFDSTYPPKPSLDDKVVYFPMTYERLRCMANALIDLHSMHDAAIKSKNARVLLVDDWRNLSDAITKLVSYAKSHPEMETPAQEVQSRHEKLLLSRLASSMEQPLDDFPVKILQPKHQDLLHSLENCLISMSSPSN